MLSAESETSPVGVVAFLFFFVGWCISVYALVRTFRLSEQDFQQTGKTRTGQLILHGIGVVTVFLGGLVGWYWLFVTRPQLPVSTSVLEGDTLRRIKSKVRNNPRPWIAVGAVVGVLGIGSSIFGDRGGDAQTDNSDSNSQVVISEPTAATTLPEPTASTATPTTLASTTPAPTLPPTTLPRGDLRDIEVRSSKFVWKDSGLDWIWRPNGDYVNRSDREIVYFQVTYEIFTTDGVFSARFVDDPDTDIPPGGTLAIMPSRWFSLYVTRPNHAQIGTALSYGGGASFTFYVNYIRYGDYTSIGTEVFL